MGGFGGGSLSSKELAALEKIAKSSIKEAMSSQPERRNVFISFDRDNLNEVNLLRGRAKSETSKLEFIDRSLKEPFNSKNEEYIKRGIRERIKQTSVTLVYLTKESATSKWVDWEIRESLRLGKAVIGVYKGDSIPQKLPKTFKEFNIKSIKWNTSNLTSEIEKAANSRI